MSNAPYENNPLPRNPKYAHGDEPSFIVVIGGNVSAFESKHGVEPGKRFAAYEHQGQWFVNDDGEDERRYARGTPSAVIVGDAGEEVCLFAREYTVEPFEA